MESPPGELEAAARLLNWAAGALAIRAVSYGLRLGLLDALQGLSRGLPAEELARRLELDGGYVAAWARAAHAAGVLERDPGSDRYRLPPGLGEVLLSSGSPAYGSGLVLTLDLETRLAAAMTERFRDGGGVSAADFGPDLPAALAALAAPVYAHLLPERMLPLLPDLPVALADGGKVLEVGCGAGGGILSLARAFPGAAVTGLDPDPAAVTATRTAIAEAGLEERVSVAGMRAEDISATQQYDLVYIQDTLDETDDAAAVLANVYRALRPGALLLLAQSGAPAPEPCPGPLDAFIAFLDAYIRLPRARAAGRTSGPPSEDDLRRWALEAGFPALEELPVALPLVRAFDARRPL